VQRRFTPLLHSDVSSRLPGFPASRQKIQNELPQKAPDLNSVLISEILLKSNNP